MKIIAAILVFFSAFFCLPASAQDMEESYTLPEKSPARKRIEKLTNPQSAKLNKVFHRLDNLNTRDKSNVADRETMIEEYEPYQGKIIRNINIEVIDPYGVNIDREETEIKPVKKFANKIHTTTRPWVVKKDLFFKAGETVDASVFVDCIRSLREKKFYKDAVLVIVPVEGTEYVDVHVLTQDRFSWNLSGVVGVDRVVGSLGINNFLGLSHQFVNRITFKYYDIENPVNGRGMYKIFNVARTPFNIEGNYFVDKNMQEYGFKVGKDVFERKGEWGASLRSYWVREKSPFPGEPQARFNYQDMWAAKALKLDKLISKSENLRFVVAGRLFNLKYSRNPYSEFDIEHQDHRFILGGIGIANKDFYLERNVYYFGEEEYLPKGFNVSFVTGYSFNELSTDRWYSGVMLNYAKSFGNLGYLFTQGSFGGFTNLRKYEEMQFNFLAQYMTRKINLGKWGFRQFLAYDLDLGYMRLYSKDLNVIEGLNTEKFRGSRKWTLDFESVIYPPFKVLWFESSVFLFGNLGMVGQQNEAGSLAKSKLYQGYGFGIRLRNKKLSLDYLELSFAFYPNSNVHDANFYNFWTKDESRNRIESNNLFGSKVLSPGFDNESFKIR